MTFETYTPRSRQVRVRPGMRLGPYEILLCVARGGMASVWAARQHGAGGFTRLVALKTVLPELDAPDLDMMFMDEARVSTRIRHPNVCEVFELIEDQGVLALSMEWVDGDTLNSVINARGKEPSIDPRVAAQIVAHAASGLHAAHELRDEQGTALQLVHRDVSPQNILLSRNGQVKVMDFGVAKSIGGIREATAIGQIKGKLSYMSPEQAQAKLLDRRSDIFSLGVVLYSITVGIHPFRRPGESRHQQLSRLVMNRIKGPSWVVKGYPPELEAIVMRALERDPRDRFANAEEMARALQRWVASSGPPVGERQIARLVLSRLGATVLERSERIAHLMYKAASMPLGLEALLDEPVPAAAEPTLVPTTSRLAHTRGAERAIGARNTLGAVSSTLTAGALFLLGSAVFTSPGGDAGALLAPPVSAAAAHPVAEVVASPVEAPPVVSAPASELLASEAPAKGLPASEAPASEPPTAGAPGANPAPAASPRLADGAPGSARPTPVASSSPAAPKPTEARPARAQATPSAASARQRAGKNSIKPSKSSRPRRAVSTRSRPAPAPDISKAPRSR
ncbi:MAG TPA: protein kinase [Polyangiaceae bacterium]|nr:protein kinase [Polyangiaceae bacterium]